VRGVDLRVERGEIFALVGPNGAGKTTTVEILAGFTPRTSGAVTVLGADPQNAPREWREQLGIVLQESAPDPGLTVAECIALYAGYYAGPRPADDVLSIVGLREQRSERATDLSGGQRRRLDLALALIGDPALLFLDEPTTGFDPDARRLAWRVIESLRDHGKSILLTTHYMEEAERLADRIAVMVDGRIVAEGTPGTLGGRDRASSRLVFGIPRGTSDDVATALGKSLALDADGRLSTGTTTPLADLERLAEWSRTKGIPVTDLELTRPSLEDVYLALTGSIDGDNT
jgi:ABC-2 type transport system ATP-binding protein